jgi:class 3 adenylate cyclase
VDIPETRYARSGDVNIAYQVAGEGDVDFLWIPGFAQHVELNWEEKYRRAWLTSLAERYRLIVFDKRGTGASDRMTGAPPLEERMDDIRAVLDAVGSTNAIIAAAGDSGALATVFAAAYPARVRGLVLHHFVPRETWAPDFPWGMPREERLRQIEEEVRRWPAPLDERIAEVGPSLTPEERRDFARILRLSLSPGAAAAFLRVNADMDVRPVLPSVHVPVLVVSPKHQPMIEASRAAAKSMPLGRFVELDVEGLLPILGDTSVLLDLIEQFVSEATTATVEHESVLATVLFTDIVGSTARAAELGDRAWHALLEQHHITVRRQLARFRGREHDTAGDGFFASFDGPARAIRCACSIRDELRSIDVDIRAGLHTGECELLDDKVAGIAVSIGARVAARAATGEVLVSQTVRDLVAGSGLSFEERGAAELKGVPGEWRLYAVADAAS